MKNINWPDHLINFISVILGVFLAFQIGSLAEKSKDRQERKEILLSFIKDLESDMEAYRELQIPANEEQSTMIGKLLGSIMANNSDSMIQQMSIAVNVQNHSPQSATYNSVVSSGKLALIKDFKAKKRISHYYESLNHESIKQGELQVEFFIGQIIPWMVDNTNMMDVDTDEIAEDTQFANRLLIYKSLIDNKTAQYISIAEASEELQVILKELLD